MTGRAGPVHVPNTVDKARSRASLSLGVGCGTQTCQSQPSQQHRRGGWTHKPHVLVIRQQPEHNLEFSRVFAYNTTAPLSATALTEPAPPFKEPYGAGPTGTIGDPSLPPPSLPDPPPLGGQLLVAPDSEAPPRSPLRSEGPNGAPHPPGPPGPYGPPGLQISACATPAEPTPTPTSPATAIATATVRAPVTAVMISLLMLEVTVFAIEKHPSSRPLVPSSTRVAREPVGAEPPHSLRRATIVEAEAGKWLKHRCGRWRVTGLKGLGSTRSPTGGYQRRSDHRRCGNCHGQLSHRILPESAAMMLPPRRRADPPFRPTRRRPFGPPASARSLRFLTTNSQNARSKYSLLGESQPEPILSARSSRVCHQLDITS